MCKRTFFRHGGRQLAIQCGLADKHMPTKPSEFEKAKRVDTLQKNKAGAEESRQSSHQPNGKRSKGQMRRLEASSSALGRGAGRAARGASHRARARARARARSSGAAGCSTGSHATAARKSLAFAGTVLQVLLSWCRHGRQSIASDIPVGWVRSWASVGTTSAVIATVTAGVLGLLESSLQGLVVGQLLDAVAVHLDQTVVAGLFGILVDETAGVDAGHLGGIESADFLELAGVGVAAILREEERNAVASEVLDLLIPARNLERRWVTPGVVVESEEVTALVGSTAVHIFGHLQTVGVDVSSRVTDGNLTQFASTQVRAKITSDSFDVRSSLGRWAIVDDLVTGEEGEGVVVLGEHVYSGEDVLQVDIVV